MMPSNVLDSIALSFMLNMDCTYYTEHNTCNPVILMRPELPGEKVGYLLVALSGRPVEPDHQVKPRLCTVCSLFEIRNWLVVVYMCLLYYGERVSLRDSIRTFENKIKALVREV